MRPLRAVMLAGLVGCSAPAGPTDQLTTDPPLPGAGYLITIRGSSHRSAAVTEPVNLSIDITRQAGGWEGPITFTAEAPDGIVVAFRPATVLRDFTDVIIVADGAVEPRDHEITFHGTVPGLADQLVKLTLTLRPQT